jgi:hypothetical protein
VQPFNTKTDEPTRPVDTTETLMIGRTDELRPGASARLELPDGDELAVYNVGGEFYATENFCPHRGAPLTDGVLYPSFPIASTGQQVSASSQAIFSSSVSGCL